MKSRCSIRAAAGHRSLLYIFGDSYTRTPWPQLTCVTVWELVPSRVMTGGVVSTGAAMVV